MPTFQLDIVTPEGTVYSGEVSSLRAPGADGGFGVLSRHQPMMAALAVGQVMFDETGSGPKKMAIGGGFANVSRDGVTLLAETAEMAEQIDIERAKAAHDRARDRIARRGDPDIDIERAQTAMMRAFWRLRVSGGA